MDTKWNNTKKTALPGNTPEKGRLRTWRAFLLFFLGWSLVLGSCGTVLAQWDCQPSLSDLLESDWQQTELFRQETAMYLKEFLTMGAGGELSWYRYGTDIREETASMWDEDATDPFSEEPASPEPQEPDVWYRQDENVLYSVSVGGTVKYGNTSPKNLTPPLTMEGYNFLLTFSDGKVSIWKDGREIDVYGDGIYRKQSAWFVPGYQNFPAGEDVKNVTVRMAVRKTPTLYYAGDYQNGGVYENCRMYWVTQRLAEGRQLYLLCAAALGLGAVLLAAARAFRRDRAAAEQTLARWTHPVWTELRALLFLACFTAILFFRSGIFSTETADVFWNSDSFSSYMGEVLWRTLQGCLGEIPLVLGLFWLCWLVHNDHRHYPKAERRSLWRLLTLREAGYPFQRRISRRNLAAGMLALGLAVLLTAADLAILVIFDGYFDLLGYCYVLTALAWLSAAAAWYALRRATGLSRDAGTLAGQIAAVRDGNLTAPVTLPQDADLRRAAEDLNDIQSGLRRALEEQTRSERLKVELVSNVSHDLKTPLTSILSYAELLRQEPLEGAAADYARIIDEKAQRLKSMVQDVFEVSKAASGQLPVTLERLDFAKLLRQTLADMQEEIQTSGLTFKVELPDEPVEITADGKRLYRVFQNLIQNALRYSLPGSRVYLHLQTGEGRAEASIRNTSRDELPVGVDFTARFVRGDASRSDGGSGLGLSIAQSFTEACGGTFRVETVADLFTAVVTFPCAPEPENGG